MKTNLNINIAKDEYGKDLIINIGTLKNLFIAGMAGSGSVLFRDGNKYVIRAQVNMFTYEEAKSYV